MRLVDTGYIRYHEAIDGTYTVNDLADLHEVLQEKAYYDQERKKIEERNARLDGAKF